MKNIKVDDKFIITDLGDKRDSTWIVTYIDSSQIKYKYFSGYSAGSVTNEYTEQLLNFINHQNIVFVSKYFEIENKIKKIKDAL